VGTFRPGPTVTASAASWTSLIDIKVLPMLDTPCEPIPRSCDAGCPIVSGRKSQSQRVHTTPVAANMAAAGRPTADL
jgi:hypothetical protein